MAAVDTTSPAYLAAIKAEAERKMAIVDALPAAARAMVHEIGLYTFSRTRPMTYRAAKARAKITGRCKFTQAAGVAKIAAKTARKPAVTF